ncbi:glucose-6-phosphate dehydrogenase [uncultured Aureimonas sp.]|uniref:glucose-6-phosphate dehydrogenase n=1 Tax=uncultured Aureimonas sp. TaxID=1604662 RepID=UPI0026015C00|nr:glucose-6-phosphate dehydrogenase [uncultured Aureimonas sp.]
MTAPTVAPVCTLVLFGAAGDLVKRLLIPSIYDLMVSGVLDPAFRIIGVDRAELDDEAWRRSLNDALHQMAADPAAEFNAGTIREDTWQDLGGRLSYQRGDITLDATYQALASRITGSAIFYCAVAGRFFGPIADGLGKAGLLQETPMAFRRLVVEKPFGDDLASARALDDKILGWAKEPQIYRIDHFLGKETVQAILALRFANRIFEPLWSSEHLDHVQITAAEVLGVEGRGSFYERAGALRDMVPNHLFQILAMVAMEPPKDLGEQAVRDAKGEVLKAVNPVKPQNMVRGQYAAGSVNGTPRVAYREEPGVDPHSRTETYAAIRIDIATPRWDGVPFYLRTGKRLTAHRTEIVLQFKPSAHPIFGGRHEANRLSLHIDGDKGLRTDFQIKAPGPGMALAPVAETFKHDDFFEHVPNIGYESLLYACMMGDASLFQRADAIEAPWSSVEPVLEAWKTGEPELYPAGSAGPASADALLARDGRAWASLLPEPDGRAGRRMAVGTAA